MAAVVSLLSLAVLAAAPPAVQQERGHIRGTIVHADGSAAARVALRVTSEQTGESRTAISALDGTFTLTSLLPGTYRLETSQGFEPATFVRTDLAAGQSVDLEIRLGLSSISMEADVRPTFVPVDRDSATSRTRIESLFIDTLPLDGRDLVDLALLAPGTSTGTVAIASNGMADPFTSFHIDGTYNTDPRAGAPVARLSLDAIDELDVRTAVLDASNGRSAGAQVLAVTRSGTNRLTGGATGFLRTHPGRAQLGAFAGGPLAVDRTFLFGSYQFTGEGDDSSGPDGGHLVSARADHIFEGSARLSGQYALDDGRPFDRRGHTAGASLHTPMGSRLTNEVRVGLGRVGFGDVSVDLGVPDLSSYQIADTVTWAQSEHLLSAGAEWYAMDHEGPAAEQSASAWGVFLHDHWRALPAVSVTAGLRFDRTSPDEADGSGVVSPRLGAVWTLDPEAHTIVRGGYGIYRNVAAIPPVTPRADQWSVSVLRRIGRTRTFEAAYLGNRVDDLSGGVASSRYSGMQLQFEQRNDLGISALVGYTYGQWTEDLDSAVSDRRAPLDSRHRLTAAFVVSLPFGDERLLFSDGLAATILGNMQLTGLFTLQSGRPTSVDREGPGHRNLDLGILKTLALHDTTLQLRAETFNVSDRLNLERGRRFQFGGRFLF